MEKKESLKPRRSILGDVFARRHEIAMAHCRANGWPEDPTLLTWEQIMQIRALPEWIDATSDP